MTARVAILMQRLFRAHHRPALTRRQHHAMFAVDITGFGSRSPHDQICIRDVLYGLLADACHHAGVPLRDTHYEDRGDGILVIARTDIGFEALLNPLPIHLAAALHHHNQTAPPAQQIQLRMAVHAGYVQPDGNGVVGRDVIHLFRLLDAPALKTLLADTRPDLALIVSDYLFATAVDYHLINPSDYQPIAIENKETNTQAWVWASSPDPTTPPILPQFTLIIPLTTNPATTSNNKPQPPTVTHLTIIIDPQGHANPPASNPATTHDPYPPTSEQ